MHNDRRLNNFDDKCLLLNHNEGEIEKIVIIGKLF